jgi:hypothetical protein
MLFCEGANTLKAELPPTSPPSSPTNSNTSFDDDTDIYVPTEPEVPATVENIDLDSGDDETERKQQAIGELKRKYPHL